MGSTAITDKKVVLITGGSSGIGLDLGRHLHAKGFLIALTSRRAAEGESVARSIDPTGEDVLFVPCDVGSYTQQAAVFNAVWARWGRLDVFVANAGGVDRDSKYNLTRRGAAVTDTPPEPDTSCTDVDLKGVMHGTVLAVHFMRHNPVPGGKIIVTGSMVGVHISPTFPEYAAAKAGAHNWVRSMAPVLLSKDNVSINVVMPGAYPTAAMPGFDEAFLPEHLIKLSVLLEAYDLFINDETNQKTGQAVEVAHETLHFYEMPEYKGGAISRSNTVPYEPWFKLQHGEKSGLPDSVPGPPGLAHLNGTAEKKPLKIIAVTGATGAQGGGVVNVMRRTPGWSVRAITRNPRSDKAKELVAVGVEVVQADFDDEASLVRAFQGAHAIYAVTNWWEHLFTGKTQAEAGELEEAQGMKLARAAGATPSLEHYLWSTEPSAKVRTEGKVEVPHMDYKARVDARIKAELPGLAAKTTYLWFGYYPQNMAFFPMLKPVFHPLLRKHVQTVATPPTAKILLSGDMTVNPGIWARQILATGSKAFGRYSNVALERLTFQHMMDEWSRITGKEGLLVECTPEAWARMWGPAGAELALQLRFGEVCDPWAEGEDHISARELGIDGEEEVVGFSGTIEGLHVKMLF